MRLQFPTGREGWEFDLVGLLAIIGEGSVSEIVQPLTAWRFVWLPRLLPAPHALIRPNRTATLPLNTEARVVGVRSGNVTESLPYFADTIHAVELLEPYTVQVVDVGVSGAFAGFRTRAFAPLNLLTLASFALTLGVLAWAVALEDGPAVVAIVLVSAAGSATSLASLWTVQLPQRPTARAVPAGDVVIFVKNGSFVVVRCTEEVARVLYVVASQRCEYVVGRSVYQALVSAGTVLLMFGIVLMANCSWVMQVVLGSSYLLLNGAYLLAALSRNTPRRWLWDLSSVSVKDVPGALPERPEYPTFTHAMWRAIYATKSARWVRAARCAPDTPAWDEWLREAERAAVAEVADWDAGAALQRALQHPEFSADTDMDTDQRRRSDRPEQHARAEEHLRETFRGRTGSDSGDEMDKGRARRRATAMI